MPIEYANTNCGNCGRWTDVAKGAVLANIACIGCGVRGRMGWRERPEPPAQDQEWRVERVPGSSEGWHVLESRSGYWPVALCWNEDVARRIAALHNDLARVTAERDALAQALRDKIAWCDDMLRTAQANASPWVRYSTTGVMGQRSIALAPLDAIQTEAP